MVARKPAFLYDLWGKQNYQELFVYRSDLGQNPCHFLPYFDYNSAVFWIFLQDKLHSFKLDHSLWHHSACASITVSLDISMYQFINVYERTSSMLLLISFVARYMEISLISFSCWEVRGNFHVSFAKISSINSLFDSAFGFLKLEVLWGVSIPKNPKVFAVLADNSHLTAEFTLFIYFLNGQK